MLASHNEGAWNTPIINRVKSKQLQHAIVLYQKMQEASVCLSGHALVTLVNACAELRDVNRGHEVHAEIARSGLLESNIYAGNSLLNMYIKCGLLARAQEVFKNLYLRDVVSWTSLIGGCITHGFNMEALKLFEQMQHEEAFPNNVTYICVLKACSNIGCGGLGKDLHDEIERKGILREDLAVANALVDMYVKCGSLAEGRTVFDQLMVRDRISWSALITGYTNCNEGAEALQSFRQMLLEGVMPDSVALICGLKACGCTKSTSIVQGSHSVIASLGLLKSHPVVGNTLIDVYAECGSLQKAQELFHKLPVQDIVSWNTLLDACVRHDCCEEALLWTERMLLEGMYPDTFTLVYCLKACGVAGAVQKGKSLHAAIESSKLAVVVCNALIDMYGKCGLISSAQKVFGELEVRDVVSWTALIAGYANHGCAAKALHCFQLMQADCVSPNAATFACVLKVCGFLKDAGKGIELHSEIERRGLLGKDSVVGNALVDMYNKCGMLKEAFEVFETLHVKDVASWNGLMTVYAKHGHGKGVLHCLTHMREEGIHPNSITFICGLKAFGCLGMVLEGIDLHMEIARTGLLLRDGLVGNAAVDMYINFGFLSRAKDVIHELPKQDILSWTSLIAGFVQHERFQEALQCVDQMGLKGLSPDAATLVCSLKACKSVGAVNKGQEIHAEIARRGLLEGDLVVGNSLVEMYATCGLLAKAHEVLDELRDRDTVSWTALIAGYVQQGELGYAIDAFESMKREGKSPDVVTFLWVLIGCVHAGEVKMGEMYFEAMGKVHAISPIIQHYTCIVDLLCRTGLIDRALEFINKMPLEPDPVVWYILLDACQKFGNVERGRKTFKHTVSLHAKDASAYISMCNIYAGLGLREDVCSSQQVEEDEHLDFQELREEEDGILVSDWN